MYYDDINVTKRKTVLRGKIVFCYNLLPLEKNFQKVNSVKEKQSQAQIRTLSYLMMKQARC